MDKLYFMHREFPGHSFKIAAMLEDNRFRARLTFADSYYFLEYCFLGRDAIGSEFSSALRTHLYNLLASFYQHYEELIAEGVATPEELELIIPELLEVAEYSREFPVSLWVFGDRTSREFLDEWMAPMPDAHQLEHLLKLPHMFRHARERLPYRYDDDKTALKRYRNALADYNRRQKEKVKAGQRLLTQKASASDPEDEANVSQQPPEGGAPNP